MTEVTCTASPQVARGLLAGGIWILLRCTCFCFCWQSWARGRWPQPCFRTVLSQDTHCSVPSRLPHLPLSASLHSFLSPVLLFPLTHSTTDSPFCTHSSGSAQLSQELSCQASEWPVKATARVKVPEPLLTDQVREGAAPPTASLWSRGWWVSRSAQTWGLPGSPEQRLRQFCGVRSGGGLE